MTLLKFAMFMKRANITLLSYEDGSTLLVEMAVQAGGKLIYAVDMSNGGVTCYCFLSGKSVNPPANLKCPKYIKDVVRFRQALYDVTVQQGFTVEGIAI